MSEDDILDYVDTMESIIDAIPVEFVDDEPEPFEVEVPARRSRIPVISWASDRVRAFLSAA